MKRGPPFDFSAYLALKKLGEEQAAKEKKEFILDNFEDDLHAAILREEPADLTLWRPYRQNSTEDSQILQMIGISSKDQKKMLNCMKRSGKCKLYHILLAANYIHKV